MSESGNDPSSPTPNDNAAQPSEGKSKALRWLHVIGGLLALVLGVAQLGKSCRWFGEGLGGPCILGDDCRSGNCLKSSGNLIGGICTIGCSADDTCGEEMRCLSGDCVPRGNRELGDHCSAPWDCKDPVCVTVRSPSQVPGIPMGLGGEGRCSRTCSDDRPCPESYRCVEVDSRLHCVSSEELSRAFIDRLNQARRELEIH